MRRLTQAAMVVLFAAVGTFATQAVAQQKNQSDMSSTEVQSEIAEALNAIKTYGYQERDQALKKADQLLLKLDTRIDAQEAQMREDWQDMTETAREKASKSLERLKLSRDKLGTQYETLTQGSEAAWDELKDGFYNAYDELRAAWDNADTNSSRQ